MLPYQCTLAVFIHFCLISPDSLTDVCIRKALFNLSGFYTVVDFLVMKTGK